MLTAEDVIAAQLQAYNDRDLELFVSYWAPDAQIYRWPDTLVAGTIEAIREAHARRFAEPYLHASLSSRMVIDDLVVDLEVITRTEHDRPKVVDVVAIYQVRAGLIWRAWFKQSQERT